jgi:hypothetical protein
MVCKECENKLKKLIIGDVYAIQNKRNYIDDNNERNVNENMMLKNKRSKPIFNKCIICKSRAENENKYCITCAYMKGICEMCGKKIAETKNYKFCDVDKKDIKRKLKMSEKSKQISEKLIKKHNLNIEQKDKKKIHFLKPKPVLTLSPIKEDKMKNESKENKEQILKEEMALVEDITDDFEYDEVVNL